MVEVLCRLDGRQPPFDAYPAGVACLEALTGAPVEDVSAALAHVREVEPRLADQFESMMRVTLAPTMIRASEKENVIPSRCTVRVDCRVPPGNGRGPRAAAASRSCSAPRARAATRSSSARRSSATARRRSPSLSEYLREFVGRADPGARAIAAGIDGFYGQPLVSEGLSGVRRVRLLSAARDVALGHDTVDTRA